MAMTHEQLEFIAERADYYGYEGIETLSEMFPDEDWAGYFAEKRRRWEAELAQREPGTGINLAQANEILVSIYRPLVEELARQESPFIKYFKKG